MKEFWFNGQCSSHFGMMATGSGAYNAPKRDIEIISIPGRNGLLTQDNGRFENVTVKYPVSITEDFAKNAELARAWLMSSQGYCRLEDDYDPDHFRMAMFQGPLDFAMGQLNRYGEATISFSCKPQRFLKSGEIPITGNFAYCNPTSFRARPLITVNLIGDGHITFHSTRKGIDNRVEFIDMDGEIILDCEMKDAYRIVDGVYENMNSHINTDDFIWLEPGYGAFIIGGDFTTNDMKIIPRWWTI